jgi:3'-phosphoadenosine 5'-phosphosulfate sulfotransferase (PAPS reductase)/FAD synthetase
LTPSANPGNLQLRGHWGRAQEENDMTPDLTSYDLILVNSSAGKDSQAMLDFVVEQARKAGVLDRVHVVHADLGRCEWEGTKELAEEQAKHYGLPFHVVKREQDLLDHINQYGMWPGANGPMRYCTSAHKRDQVKKLVTKLGNEIGKGARILNCMGLRADESPARAQRQPFSRDERSSNTKRSVDLWLPIFEWTEEQVWWRIMQAGTRYHKAYDLGMPRLSCCFCVFAPKGALMIAAKHNPDLFQEYLETEKRIGHKFRQNLGLIDIDLALKAGETPKVEGAWVM